MEEKDFIQRFFSSVDTSRYEVYTNRNKLTAVDFGHKQLHEGYIAELYKRALKQNGELSTTDFAELVPGRPCASVPFFQTCLRAKLCAFVGRRRNTKIYRVKV